MSITFAQARQTVAQYQGRGGKCPVGETADTFTLKVLQYMLFSGAHGHTRKFTFYAVKGCFTAPHELEVPLKIKVDGKVGDVWSRWYEFHTQNDLEGRGVELCSTALYEEPNEFPTVYDGPTGGFRAAIMGTCDEDGDAHAIIQGVTPQGREIFTIHKGQQVSGEYLSIKKGELRYTTTVFGQITGVVKTKTKGYTPFYWLAPTSSIKGFLAEYSPIEEIPSYRRFRLTANSCPAIARVSVLGRIRLKDNYSDNDKIPFDNLFTLELAAQGIHADYNNDIQTAQAKDVKMQELITREGEFKRVTNGQPVEVYKPTSGGAIKNAQ